MFINMFKRKTKWKYNSWAYKRVQKYKWIGYRVWIKGKLFIFILQ